jgi:ATP-dependent DNA ligase
MASAKPCAAFTSASNVPAANTDVVRAKKTARRKTGAIILNPSGSGRRQSNQAAIPLPDFVEPMKATLVNSMPTGSWIYEIKFDGYRALALRGGNQTRILSRNQKDLGKKFQLIANSIAELKVQDAVIDGEIVALDDKGDRHFSCCKALTWV